MSPACNEVVGKIAISENGNDKREEIKRQPRADKRFCYVATSECKPRLPSEL